MAQYDFAGRVQFGDVSGVEQFSMTRSRGISPGTIQFAIPEPVQFPLDAAPLILEDGQNRIVIKDCIYQTTDVDYTNGVRYIVTLLDYRWKWQFGRVGGRYNEIKGGTIVPSTKKKPRELAEICLVEMGVERWDLSQLPNDTYPEINWEDERPAQALESLCAALGCVICPQLDGSVLIAKNGVGKKLPIKRGGDYRESFKAGIVPDNILMHANPTVWEVSLKLEKPFGLEQDISNGVAPVESIVPIEKLSYKPRSGWESEDPKYFANVAANTRVSNDDRLNIKERDRIRGLATASVWKMWGFKFPIKLHDLPFEIKDINQLVFHDELLVKTRIEFESPLQGRTYELRRKAPFAYGRYYDLRDLGKNNVETFSHDWTKDKMLLYSGSFNIDKERGIVVLSDPAFIYDRSVNAAKRIVPPEIWVRVAVSVRDPKTGELWRHTYKKPTGRRNKTPDMSVKRPDLQREIIVDPKTGKPFPEGDNKAFVEGELARYAGFEMQKLTTMNPAQGEYDGFELIELDGTIEQVTYAIDGEGWTTTTASYGYEHSLVVPSAEERRRIAMLQDFVKVQDALMGGAPKKD